MPLASARSGQRERVFMITGIGVHDRTDWPFTITGMRTKTGKRQTIARGGHAALQLERRFMREL
jgi:hypothetical protein